MRTFFIAILLAYKRFLSPYLPRACRFSPTCSEYSRLALLEHGLLLGIWLTLKRVARCQVWHPGGIDLP